MQLVRVDVDDAKVDFELVNQNSDIEEKNAEDSELLKNKGNGQSKDGFANRKKSKSNGKSNGKVRRRSRKNGN